MDETPHAEGPPSEEPGATVVGTGMTIDEVEALWGDSTTGLDPAETSQTLRSSRLALQSQTRVSLKSHLVIESATPNIERTVSLSEAAAGETRSEGTDPDYEIFSVLGEGGMGVVYTARQTAIDRNIAVKMIRRKDIPESEKAKFLFEAAVTGDLEHPNIVPVYDLGTDQQGTLFYAMKAVKGTEWQEVIDAKSLEANLETLLRVADALAFAHSRGTIHRDLKPSNVMLGDYGEVLLMDWGLAASFREGGKAAPLSETVALGGTPAYMAPEMASGDVSRIGPGSDIYLLGALLYRILTGRPPHTGSNVMDCIRAAVLNEITPTEVAGELMRIARRAMADEPADRYATVKDFQDAVRSYQAHAESLALSETARADLANAESTGEYDAYARAVFGFDQAAELWDGNADAREGRIAARLAYSVRAYEQGDYDLAASQLLPGEESHAAHLRRVEQARRTRARREKTVRALVVLALLLVLAFIGSLLYGFLKIREENEKTRAARDAEATARETAEAARATAEYDAYVARIGLAAEKIEEDALENARALLGNTPPGLRHWEWGRLELLTLPRGDTFGPWDGPVRALALPDSGSGGAFLAFTADGAAPAARRTAYWTAGAPTPTDVTAAASVPGGGAGRLLTGHGSGAIRLHGGGGGGGIDDAHAGAVLALAVSPGGNRFASAGAGGTAAVWSIGEDGTPARLHTLQGHGGAVRDCAWDRNGDRVLTGGDDGIARIWNAEDGTLLRELRDANTWTIFACCFCPSGETIVTAGDGWEATVYSLETGEAVRIFPHNGTVRDVAFSPDRRLLLTASDDKTAAVWEWATGRAVRVFREHAAAVTAASFAGPDTVLTASADGTVRRRPLEPFRGLLRLRGHEEMVRAGAFCGTRGLVVTGGADNAVRLWDAETGTTRAVLTGHTDQINGLAVAPGCARVATAASDGTVRVWSIPQAREILAIRADPSRVETVAWSPDGTRLVSANRDATARVFRAADGELLLTLEGHGARLRNARFSPDGSRIVTASEDRTAIVWDAETGAALRTLTGHDEALFDAAFSPGGARLATGGADWTIRLWDAETGAHIRTLPGHAQAVFSLHFLPGGRRLLSASGDGTAKIWDPEAGREILSLTGHAGAVRALDYDPATLRVLTGGYDRTAVVWEALDWTEPPAEAGP